MAKVRPKRSGDELIKASHHLYYEFSMLNETAIALSRGPSVSIQKKGYIKHFIC